MKTDSIFYQLFQTFPRCFFDLLNLPAETVNDYQFSSVEVKQLAFRLDGVFLPNSQDKSIYFVEVQFQKDNKFYSRFFSEIFLYLHQSELNNNWRGVIIYPNRRVENIEVSRYQELLNSERVCRFYLDELATIETVGIKTLKLIISSEKEAIPQGKALIQKVKEEFRDAKQQENILQLIETILVYKLPLVNRQEIEKMFSLSDLRETKVYQEALEEGRLQGELVAKQNLILRQLNLKIGKISPNIQAEVKQLTLTELDNLALALFDFLNVEDLQQWLTSH
ncbi:Rpn family recombination-promoting nuclease/putative transposase [Cyanothece sp. BG0011]|uniref:Rpn family recombination-promoting nuclease/putative transposase n=1 Tax=Cyanothece sp. BG0011 TaxID=2082950 RepID=UPI000D1F33FA|nr:Rpn family recombination-promoting nuclease/putative transposase [Cyanothece sp. BG0011]